MRSPHLCRWLLFVALCWLPGRAAADPICCGGERGPTLVGDFNQASLVLLGTFTNPQGVAGNGTTDFAIAKVFKGAELVGTKKVLEKVPKHIASKSRFLVFFDFYKGVIDPYRGVEVAPGGEVVEYLAGALAVKDRPLPDRLRYAFDYLNSPDPETAMDAFREYARSSYADYREMARGLPADKLAGWLRDPKTSPARYGLYAMLLGQCGKAEHAALLRKMLDDPPKQTAGGTEGLLAGYLMLQPKEGRDYLRGLLKDGKQDFLTRYAGVRTVRFLREQRPVVMPEKEAVSAVALVLDHHDMADFAVEDLRKWKRWEYCGRILGLFGKGDYDTSVMRRSILRYALQCPEKQAVAFVAEQRRRDRAWVEEVEELLRLENETPGASEPAKGGSGSTGSACVPQAPEPLGKQVHQAQVICHARVAGSVPLAGEKGFRLTFQVLHVLKGTPVLVGKTTIIKEPAGSFPEGSRWLLFCGVNKQGEVHPDYGVPVSSDALLDYCRGLLSLPANGSAERLAYCLRHLEHPDPQVSLDIFRTLNTTKYPVLRRVAAKASPKSLVRLLGDKTIFDGQRDWYAFLLGHCGAPEHLTPLRQFLAEPGQHRERALMAWILLRPEEGWPYVQKLLANPEELFLTRFHALRAVRFFWNDRTDVLPKTDLVVALLPTLGQEDMADFAIEAFRSWQRWELTRTVLRLCDKPSHHHPVIRRAILRFALQSPHPQAAAFVRAQRLRDREWVEDIEDHLRLEGNLPASGKNSVVSPC
ncbi:MAG: hypothetical protein L0Z62_42295 [Gemmataceae bacterium]|nr:hypothetical protein [Gemmataceae bacterium]